MQVHSCPRCHTEGIRSSADPLLCAGCVGQVERQLRALPYLHQECLNHVSPTSRRTNPTKVSGSRRNDFLDISVLDSRHNILAVLESWSEIVLEQLGCAAPERTVPHLARFLIRHLTWLTAQPPAAEFADEIESLAGELRRIVDPDPGNLQALIRKCVVEGCNGTISASPQHQKSRNSPDSSVSCSAGHSWKMHELLLLGRLMERQRKGVSA